MAEIEALIERLSNSPTALAGFARTFLLSKGLDVQARELCLRAVALAPDDGEVQAITREVFSQDVASWYFPMVLDVRRHAAYELALCNALKAGGSVLDIGAGTGLFAMLAARAGADSVFACENKLAMADASRSVIAKNGLQDKVEIIPKRSTDLVVGQDIPERVDVLLWDNLANNMIGAGCLATLEDAVRRLLKPGGAVMPAQGSIKVALAEDLNLSQHRVGVVDDFDLSPLNAYAVPAYTIGCFAETLILRSDAATLFEFDFQSGGPFAADRAIASVIGKGGLANGIVQWIEFQLDDNITFSAAPGEAVWAFGLEFYPTTAPFDATFATAFEIGGSHDRRHLRVWRET